MRASAHYFVAFFCAMTLILGATATINYLVDSQNIYGSRAQILPQYIRDYVARLRASKNGLIYIPYERRVKLELARRTTANCLVTGSSHEMQIGLAVFPSAIELGCNEITNLAVSSGGYEDFIIMVAAIPRRAGKRKLFVGIQPWMLRRNADVKFLEQPDLLPAARKNLGLPTLRTDDGLSARTLNLINGRYLRENFKYLLSRGGRIDLPEVREPASDASEDMVFLSDGRIEYAHSSQGNPLVDGSENIRQPYVDSKVIEEMEKVIGYLEEEGFEVIPLLMPLSPEFWKCHKRYACDALVQIEGAIRDLARKNRLRVMGSFNPGPFGLSKTDFRDTVHLEKSGLRRIQITTQIDDRDNKKYH